MKKKMTTIIIIVAVALAGFIGFGFYKASELTRIQIVKSVTIKGSKAEVFDMVRYLKTFRNGRLFWPLTLPKNTR